jgi:hypothetical protein
LRHLWAGQLVVGEEYLPFFERAKTTGRNGFDPSAALDCGSYGLGSVSLVKGICHFSSERTQREEMALIPQRRWISAAKG